MVEVFKDHQAATQFPELKLSGVSFGTKVSDLLDQRSLELRASLASNLGLEAAASTPMIIREIHGRIVSVL